MNRSDIIATVAEACRRFDARIVAAWVFGSVGRDEMRADSDVDVAVRFASAPEGKLAAPPGRLEAELAALLSREVQVIDLHRAPVDLIHRVLRDGVLVYEGDASARIAFEVRTRNEYFDLLPTLQRYRREVGA
ncbi:MAG: nucleotidyltransferase domain-containing protein [Pseudomonadota bacterium]